MKTELHVSSFCSVTQSTSKSEERKMSGSDGDSFLDVAGLVCGSLRVDVQYSISAGSKIR